MKLSALIVLLLISTICSAQEREDEEDEVTGTVSRIDSLLKRKTSLDTLLSVMEKRMDTSKALVLGMITRRETITLTHIATMMTDYDNLKSAIDSQKKVSDTIKSQIDSLRKVQAVEQAKSMQLIAEISKREDSAHAIAKIRLKTDIKGKTYKIKVHVDGLRITDKIANINSSKKIVGGYDKRNTGDYPSLKKHEIRKLFLPFIGFHRFKDSVVTRIVDSIVAGKQWRDSIPVDYSTRREFRVEEVRLNVFEGMIREINVKTSHGIFRNLNGPIDLVHMGNRLDDRLYRDGEKMYEDEYLVLGEVIDYRPIRSNNDLPYTQFDITLTPDTPNHVHDTYTIEESTSINTYFDVAVFSDIKGLSGDANGIAQTTASAKFITNTRNFRNKALIPMNYLSFMGGLSKFDNEFKGTLLENKDSVNRKDLLQRSNYYAGLKLNLLHWILSPKPARLIQDIQLNVGYNFVGSKTLKVTANVIDSTGKQNNDSMYNTVTHNMVYFEPIVSLNRYRNFNMAVSLPFYFINLKQSSGIANRETERWVRPSIELMYFSKRNSSSKVFFRYNHWINLKKKENAFIQMQLGYSANLGDLFKND